MATEELPEIDVSGQLAGMKLNRTLGDPRDPSGAWRLRERFSRTLQKPPASPAEDDGPAACIEKVTGENGHSTYRIVKVQ